MPTTPANTAAQVKIVGGRFMASISGGLAGGRTAGRWSRFYELGQC